MIAKRKWQSCCCSCCLIKHADFAAVAEASFVTAAAPSFAAG